jgi:hypothetical protein
MKLIDLIFKGEISKINLSFLEDILKNDIKRKLIFPEIDVSLRYEDIVNILNENSDVDFTVSTNKLNILEQIVPSVFIHLILNDNILELLFFFDPEDLRQDDYKANFNLLRIWALDFKGKYGFESVLCQIDNGNEDEYYFNDNDFGPMYKEL